jgi:hypothetical protein
VAGSADVVRLSRFIFSERHFKAGAGVVRHGAFMPPQDGKLSVFDTEALPEIDVWEIGESVTAQRVETRQSESTLYARADISTAAVTRRGLMVLQDEPPPRHRSIEGWPRDTKEDQKLIAIELAAEATLRTR